MLHYDLSVTGQVCFYTKLIKGGEMWVCKNDSSRESRHFVSDRSSEADVPVGVRKGQSRSASLCADPQNTELSGCPLHGSDGCDAQQLNVKHIRKKTHKLNIYLCFFFEQRQALIHCTDRTIFTDWFSLPSSFWWWGHLRATSASCSVFLYTAVALRTAPTGGSLLTTTSTGLVFASWQ